MSHSYEDEKSFDDLEEVEYQDISGTIAALEQAWRCAPEASLSELIDSVTPMPFCELTNAEFIEALNEFIHQNSK